jgi:hypothetical protein
VIKLIAVFYIITFNCIATFTVKVYQCATSKGSATKTNNATVQSQAGEAGGDVKSSSKAALGGTGSNNNLQINAAVGKNPKLPQSSALVKSIGGLKGLLGENRKYFLSANSEYILVLYPAVKINVEDNKTNASSVGLCWNASQANDFEVLVHSPAEIRVKIDSESYHLTYDDEAVATVWNTYFQVNTLPLLFDI